MNFAIAMAGELIKHASSVIAHTLTHVVTGLALGGIGAPIMGIANFTAENGVAMGAIGGVVSGAGMGLLRNVVMASSVTENATDEEKAIVHFNPLNIQSRSHAIAETAFGAVVATVTGLVGNAIQGSPLSLGNQLQAFGYPTLIVAGVAALAFAGHYIANEGCPSSFKDMSPSIPFFGSSNKNNITPRTVPIDILRQAGEGRMLQMIRSKV